jgi:hypothetical protein
MNGNPPPQPELMKNPMKSKDSSSEAKLSENNDLYGAAVLLVNNDYDSTDDHEPKIRSD